jgi:hypothetical protein
MISIRIYKDIPQGKIVVTFRNFTSACACLPVRVRTQTGRLVHKRSTSQDIPI